MVGCAQPSGETKTVSLTARSGGGQVLLGPDQLTVAQVQSEVMSFADTYATTCAQTLDTLRSTTKRPEVATWALETKISTATAAYSNATGPNEVVNLLDMLVLVTLKRLAIEDHWNPNFLHEEGRPVLETYDRMETRAWRIAARAFTPEQIEETHTLIDQWRADNPDQYYVSHIRFTEFAAARRVSGVGSKPKKSGSILGMLYLDPLANLDPVAQELQNYRDLSERLLFLVERMHLLLGWEAELIASRATSMPDIRDFVQSAGKFADATTRLADTAAKFPQDVSTERQAAVTQISDEMAKQRIALMNDVEQQSERLNKLLAHAGQLIDQVGKTGAGINSDTTATVLAGEQASRRVLNHAFALALVLTLVVILGIPLSALWKRRMLNRPVQGPSD